MDREREVNFMDREPAVVIIGAGQSGLDVAARLKCLGIECLLIERNKEVGQVMSSLIHILYSCLSSL